MRLLKNIFLECALGTSLVVCAVSVTGDARADVICAKSTLKNGKVKIQTQSVVGPSCPKRFQVLFDTANLVPVIAASIPKGERGETGEQGPAGPSGAPGPQGAPGSDATFVGVPAGGSLIGAYPNPSLASAVVGPENVGLLPGVRIRRTSTQTFPNTISTVEFDVEDRDDLDFFSGSGSEVVIPLAGTYLISGEVSVGSSPTGIRLLIIQRNQSATLASQHVPGTLNGNQLSVSTVMRLNGGDTIRLRFTQNSGAPLDTFSVGGAVSHAYLALQWLGP